MPMSKGAAGFTTPSVFGWDGNCSSTSSVGGPSTVPGLRLHQGAFSSWQVMWGSNSEGLSATQWPGYLQSNTLAPATGASIVLLAVPHLRARADYRRVWQRDQVVTSPFLNASGQLSSVSMSRVSTQRAGASVGYDFGQLASSDGAVPVSYTHLTLPTK